MGRSVYCVPDCDEDCELIVDNKFLVFMVGKLLYIPLKRSAGKHFSGRRMKHRLVLTFSV